MEYDRSKDPMLAMDYWKPDAPKYSDLHKEIESLRQQLAECQKAFETESRDIDLILNHFGMDINKFRTEGGFLNKYHIASELRHLQNVSEKLATVTAERDELVAALKDAYPYETHLADGCDCPWCKALAKVGADKTGEK